MDDPRQAGKAKVTREDRWADASSEEGSALRPSIQPHTPSFARPATDNAI